MAQTTTNIPVCVNGCQKMLENPLIYWVVFSFSISIDLPPCSVFPKVPNLFRGEIFVLLKLNF